MKRIEIIFIGVLFSLIAAGVFSYCLIFLVRAFVGGGEVKASDIWIFYAISLPTALTFGFVANYLYSHPLLTKKKLWTLTFVSVFCISLLVGGVGVLASHLYMPGHLPDMYNYSGRIGWGLVYSFSSMPFSILFCVITIKALSKVNNLIKTRAN